MSFDDMYDEMLHDEFSSRGKHAAKAAAVETEPAPSPVRGRHTAVGEADTVEVGAVQEPVTEAVERPRGFQRYRTAALVGAGGMACAAAGAFLGGLGGYFTVSPAAAHPLSSPTVTQDLPLAQAVSNAAHSSTSPAQGTSAVAAASFSRASGSLTQGIAPFTTLTSEPLANLPVVGLPGLPGTSSVTTGSGGAGGGSGDGSGGGSGDGGGTTGTTGCQSTSSDLGLTCILQSLTSALSNLGSLSAGDPTGLLNGLVPTLSGVVSDVTGTLANLNSLLPIASLPTGGAGGLTGVLAGAPTGVSTGTASTTGGSTGSGSPSPLVSALAPVLNGVAALTGGATGSGSTSLPSLPLSSSSGGTSLPSLPVTSSGSTGPAPTVTTPTSGSSGNTNTLNVPIPLPLGINVPTISIGGLSLGINSTDSGSGLTLSLP